MKYGQIRDEFHGPLRTNYMVTNIFMSINCTRFTQEPIDFEHCDDFSNAVDLQVHLCYLGAVRNVTVDKQDYFLKNQTVLVDAAPLGD